MSVVKNVPGGGPRKRFFLRVAEKILWVIGAAALGAYVVSGIQARLFQNREKQALRSAIEQQATAPADRPGPVIQPSAGDLIGEIDIPRLGVTAIILEGDDAAVLRLGAGHIPGTPLPGSDGNVSIAGHRDTFFRPLRKIRPNDLIEIKTPRGTLRYFVDWTRIVDPTDVDVLDPTAAPALTLVTCYPFYYVGPAPRRFVVRAHLTCVAGRRRG